MKASLHRISAYVQGNQSNHKKWTAVSMMGWHSLPFKIIMLTSGIATICINFTTNQNIFSWLSSTYISDISVWDAVATSPSRNIYIGIHKNREAPIDSFDAVLLDGDDDDGEINQKECTNTAQWLQGPRYGNIHYELSDTLVQDMIEMNITHILQRQDSQNTISSIHRSRTISTILEQTLCYPHSSFLTFHNRSITTLSESSQVTKMIDPTIVRHWAVKFIFLSLHYHQHRYAISEAKQRYYSSHYPYFNNEQKCPTQEELTEQYGVGRFDYECPGAKYLVMSLGGNGLGANVRGGMVPAMILGLITNRIVLIMNNVQGTNTNSSFVKLPWTLASCPRKDYQCFFWPTSPCVITQDDMDQAYVLSKPESRALYRLREPPKDADHYKVWVWETLFNPVSRFHQEAADVLYTYSRSLLLQLQQLDKQHQQSFNQMYDLVVLEEAVELILNDDGDRDVYNYAGASHKIQHAMTMYVMRPHPIIQRSLNDIISDMIAPYESTFDAETTIGLPIRASDKCRGESECLSFEQHMIIVSEMWEKHLNRTNIGVNEPSIIFTTEDTSMVLDQQKFVTENKVIVQYPNYQYHFLTNRHDVTPNSGFINDLGTLTDIATHYFLLQFVENDYILRHVFTLISLDLLDIKDQNLINADEIMISALSSLKAQLLPRVSIGNCCSNFHILINDFLSEGCGAASMNTFQCMQETDDPLLVVCCGWQGHCKARKEQLLLDSMNSTSVALIQSRG